MHNITNLDFRILFEEVPGYYIVLQPDLTIITCSKTWLKITNTTFQSTIGKKMYDVVPVKPADASGSIEFFSTSVNSAIELGEPYPGGMVKHNIVGSNGIVEERSWRTFFIPVRNNDSTIPFIIVKMEDVAELMALKEEKLKWREQFSQDSLLIEELRLLSGHLQDAREEERAHLAKEIHDELGQQMTVIKMDVTWLCKALHITDERLQLRMDGLMQMLDKAVKKIRRISAELRPGLLDDMGVMAAIEWQLSEFAKRWGVQTHFSGLTAEPPLEDSTKIGLFRILQESLNNVAHHANAKNIWVSLVLQEKELHLNIKDDGRGFGQKAPGKKTFGLIGIKERTMMMGGKYEIKSIPQKGTTVAVIMPMRHA